MNLLRIHFQGVETPQLVWANAKPEDLIGKPGILAGFAGSLKSVNFERPLAFEHHPCFIYLPHVSRIDLVDPASYEVAK